MLDANIKITFRSFVLIIMHKVLSIESLIVF